MTALVLGSSGQIASHLREHLRDAVYWGRKDFDLTAEPAGLEAAVVALGPRVIVNTAAYTAVDKAEADAKSSWNLNAAAPAAAARAASVLDIPLVHFSTDYVFDGRSVKPYAVDDAPGPLNVYGATKLAGEIAVRTLCRKHWILRTSWVFSEHGANFLKTMLRLANGGSVLKVVADQHGVPTYAGDLAALAARIADAPDLLPHGTYHAVGGAATTWHGFAETIVRRASERGMLAHPVTVTPISTAEYPTAARRPARSVLQPSTDLARTGVRLDWNDGVDRALARLAG